MVKKEFIGLSYDTDRIRVARIRANKSRIELLEVDTIHLPQPIVQSSDSEFGAFELDDDLGDLFDEEDSGEGTAGLGDFMDSPSEESSEDSGTTSLEESFDMTRTGEEEDLASENEQVVADYLKSFGAKKLRIGTHIPFGKTTFQYFKNTDPGSMKKKDRIEFFEEKLGPIHNKEVLEEDYAWVKIGENDCLVGYTPNERLLINLIEVAETYFNGKLLINERLPDEGIWSALVATNYDLKEDDITGLIAIGESASRILFMKGNEIISILPIITEGESSDRILNTIFSKILFEIDKGDLPKITRLLITRSAKVSEKAKEYLDKQFDDVEVDFLTLNPEKVSYADEILDSSIYLQPYLSAIGAAWAASKIDEKEFSKFSTLPEYILERQRVLKLEWHGIAILILIALTPLYLNNMYNEKADELRLLEQEVQSLETQIEDLRPIAIMTEDLIGDLQLIQNENERLLELAAYSQKWSEMIRMMNSGIYQIPNIWITSLRTADQNVTLTGISLTREEIPRLANLFSDAHIQQVSETEIRTQPVYSFSMQANNFRQDIDEILIEMPSYDYNSEIQEGFEISYSDMPEAVLSDNEPAELTANIAENRSSESVADSEPETPQQTESLNAEPIESSVQSNDDGNSDQQNPGPDENELSASENEHSSSSYGLTGHEDQLLYGAYTIVLHSLADAGRAEEVELQLQQDGYKTTLWPAEINRDQMNWRIGVGQFETIDDAVSAADELPEPYRSDHFIIRIR